MKRVAGVLAILAATGPGRATRRLAGVLALLAAIGSGCGTRQVGGDSGSSGAPAPADNRAAAQPVPIVTPLAETPPATVPAVTAPAAALTTTPAPSPTLAGDYECRVTRGERDLPPAPCAIRAGDDGALHLEQTAGQVRLNGAVTADDAGFRLVGDLSCSRGPCPGKGPRDLRFFSQGSAAYSAVIALRTGLFVNIDLIRK